MERGRVCVRARAGRVASQTPVDSGEAKEVLGLDQGEVEAELSGR